VKGDEGVESLISAKSCALSAARSRWGSRMLDVHSHSKLDRLPGALKFEPTLKIEGAVNDSVRLFLNGQNLCPQTLFIQ
jgi:hypothetical protein